MRDDRKIKNEIPKVGEYRLGDDGDYIAISLSWKPNWIQRFIVKIIFSATWVDYTEIKNKPTFNSVKISNM